MIIDVPTGDDFKSFGIDYLNLAWNTLVSLLKELEEAQYYEGDYELSPDKYWKKAQRSLSTALSLIQQGTEFLLKGHIATVSPYLLISGEPRNYPKTSDENNVRFSDFKTIDAQDLISVYNTVSVNRLPNKFQQKFYNLRSKRNIIMHTVDSNLQIDIKDLFIEILEIYDHLITPGGWIENRRNSIPNEPQSALFDSENLQYDSNIYQLAFEINIVIEELPPSEVSKYFKLEKKQRRYICPVCYSRAFRETYRRRGASDDDIPRLAQLIPNEPTSNSIYCIVCNNYSSIVRKDCLEEDCQGNVIDDKRTGMCLTCCSDEQLDI